MDKNNDIKVYKVSRWKVAPDSIKDLHYAISGLFDRLSLIMDVEEGDNSIYTLSGLLAKVLDDYNELEAKYQESCGMISQYEEENKNLKSELDIMTDENDCLITRVFKQDEEYAKLEAKDKECAELRESNELCMKAHLRLIDESTELVTENTNLKEENARLKDRCNELTYRSAKYAWAIKTMLRKATFSPGHVAEELRFMARKSTAPKDVCERWEGYADELLGEHSKLVEENKRLEKENEKLENALNDKKVTTWEEVESEIFAPEEIAESQFRVEHMLCNAMRTHYIQLMADENKRLKKKNEEVKKENDDLKQTLLNILEKLETKVGLCRIHLLDSYEDRANLIMVEHDRLLIKYEKLKKENDELKTENNNLTTDNKRLNNAVEAWFDMFNDMRHKRDDLKKECKKLKKENDELENTLNDKNKLICKLAPKKSNSGSNKVPPTGCCGCCTVCTLKDICWILND